MYELIEQDRSPQILEKLPSQWEKKELAQVVKAFISGGTPSTQRPELWDGSIPWTTSAPISEMAVMLDTPQRFISEQGLQESASHLVPTNSLLIGTRVGVGKAVVASFDVAISQDLTGAILDIEQALPKFVAYQFKTERIQSILEGSKRGTTIKGISRFDLQHLNLYLPSLPEQRTIAHILQTVQNAIQVRRKELELERECKAALMQHLFTYGTQSEATKQTEIGEIPESWKIVFLQDLIESGPKNGLYKHQSAYGSGTLIIRINDFNNEGEIISGGSNKVLLSETEKEEFQVKDNDILINRVNSLSHLGKSALIRNMKEENVFESNMMRIKINVKYADPEYIFRYLNSHRMRTQIQGKARHAVAQSSINQGDVNSLILPVPSLDQQREIVNVMSTCDSKIAALEKEIVLQEELFRALLEELMSGRLSALPLVE